MRRQSAVQRKFLAEAMWHYHRSLPGSPGEEHLATRGLTSPTVASEVAKFRLGYVSDPLPGHEMYVGMLAIPYLRWSPGSGGSVATIRFRCVRDGCDHKNHTGGKYSNIPGHGTKLFNTPALLLDTEDIGVSEGEIDAITATLCGVPTVGVPGAENWKGHFREPLLGYRTVFVFADNDDDGAGLEFAKHVVKELSNAKIVLMPRGHDVSSFVLAQGKHALLERMGL